MSPLLDDVSAALAAGDTDVAVRAAYDGAYRLMERREWPALDAALRAFPAGGCPAEVLHALETITGLTAVRHRLPSREAFLERARAATAG